MKRAAMVIVSILCMSFLANLAAQEFDPSLDKMYSGSFHAALKFDINDELQGVYFSVKGAKWSEYEIIGNSYLGEGKGWVYKVTDAMGNQYTIKRPGLDSDITVSPVNGKTVTLKAKKS
jgi:hypothetical protein